MRKWPISRSSPTASSATCTRSRWWAWTVRLTGAAYFNSPSIFAAILDEHKGGFFKIASLYEAQHKQMYLPDSNVLVTRFLSPAGVGEVVQRKS